MSLDRYTPTQLRRLGEIGEALASEFGEVRFADPADYVFVPGATDDHVCPSGICAECGCIEEAGWCYCCHPVEGYGRAFRSARHPADPETTR